MTPPRRRRATRTGGRRLRRPAVVLLGLGGAVGLAIGCQLVSGLHELDASGGEGGSGGTPSAPPCCRVSDEPGCADDAAIATCVCKADAFCCASDGRWAARCVLTAELVCGAACALGTPCTRDLQCPSGHCRDAVCCTAACDAPCSACTKAFNGLLDGVCSEATDGEDPRDECGDGVCLDGACEDSDALPGEATSGG